MKILSKVKSITRRFYYKTFIEIPVIVNEVRKESITYLDEPALLDLYNAVSEIKAKNIEGIVIEAGCALGGSAIVIGTALGGSRDLYVYDTFGMIPQPTDNDGSDVKNRYEVIKNGESKGLNGNLYYGYEEDLLFKVKENFNRHNLNKKIHFVQGLFEETLNIKEAVALAHIDGDWYSSVLTCLQQIAPKMSPGGIMVIDDYHQWSGCKKAVRDYFSDKGDKYRFVEKSRLHIIKK